MRFLTLFASVSITATAGLQAASFTDSTFNLSNYSETPVFQTSGSDTVTFSQCSTCGNTGQALQINIDLPTGLDIAAIGFINNSFSYNPGIQGAISTIDASVDKNIITNIPVDPSNVLGNTFRPLIEQDGVFYLAPISGPIFDGGTTGFNTIAQTGLTANDFVSYDFTTGTSGTAHPNFAGDPILLGIGQLAQFTGSNVDFTGIYDNLNLTVNAVPEPSAFLPVLLSLAGLAWTKRRHSHRA